MSEDRLLSAHELSQEIAVSSLSLEDKVEWHLRLFDGKFPISTAQLCISAIKLAQNGYDLDTVLTLPEPLKWKERNVITAKDAIEVFYLDYFIGANLE